MDQKLARMLLCDNLTIQQWDELEADLNSWPEATIQEITRDLSGPDCEARLRAWESSRDTGLVLRVVIATNRERARAAAARKYLSKGGRTRAESMRGADPNAWMKPIFDEAYANLDADGSKQRGHAKLRLMAHRIAGPGHPDHDRREKLTERRARDYLKARRAATK